MDDLLITEPYDQMTEDQAIDMAIELERRFGWSATIITRRDVEDRISRKMTEDQWQRLSSSREWQRHVADAMWEGVGDAVFQAVEDVLGIELDNSDD